MAARLLEMTARWALLGELARGAALPVSELAPRTGISREQTSKYMLMMLRPGLVVKGWGGLYVLAPALAPAPGSREVRFGPCTLHFG